MYDNDDLKNELIEGRNAVTEALRSGRPIEKIYIAKGETDKALGFIASSARDKGFVVVEADRKKLDFMSETKAHQGVIAVVGAKEYCTVDDILAYAEEKGEPPFIIICDEISDPHNLGAIIRSADCSGVHGVITPKRRNAGLTAVVSKTSAGALEYVPVARVSNLSSTIKYLKDKGVWIYGTAANGSCELWNTDFSGPIALVIGSEGSGIGRLVAENCDFTVSIPMKGHIDSLNASCAATILMYEIFRQRLTNK